MANIDPDANDFRGSNLQELPRYPPSRPIFFMSGLMVRIASRFLDYMPLS